VQRETNAAAGVLVPDGRAMERRQESTACKRRAVWAKNEIAAPTLAGADAAENIDRRPFYQEHRP
jgi:hypothetical protein